MIDQRDLAVGAFESPCITSSSRRLVRLDLRGVCTNSSTTITAFQSAYKFLPQPTVPHDVNGIMHIPKLQFADPRESEDLPIEILVRGNHYRKTVKDSPPWHISPSLVLLPSRLGWVLSGNRSGISVNVATVNLLHLEGPSPLFVSFVLQCKFVCKVQDYLDQRFINFQKFGSLLGISSVSGVA